MKKEIHYLTAAEAIDRLRALKSAVGGNDPFVLDGDHGTGRKRTFCVLELARSAANNVYKSVSRSGQPVIVARRTKAPAPMLSVDEALELLEKLVEQAGSAAIPLLADTGTQEYQLCDLISSTGGASDILRPVSRGGKPLVIVALWPPTKD